MRAYRYPWPASRIDPALMALLHATRERQRPRRPITVLVAEAVRETVLRFPGSNNPKEAA